MNDEEKIKKIISDQLCIAAQELTPNADLRKDLNAEDLEVADLFTKLEKEFSQHVTPQDARKLRTVNDIVAFFQET